MPQLAEVAQGVPGGSRLRIFLTFRHYKGGRSSAKRTGRLYPRRNPRYSLAETESTSGHMVLLPQALFIKITNLKHSFKQIEYKILLNTRQWSLNYYKGAEDLGQPHHSNFLTLFWGAAHQEGEEEGNKETHTKEDREVMPK